MLGNDLVEERPLRAVLCIAVRAMLAPKAM
jgi:hypothetical protein